MRCLQHSWPFDFSQWPPLGSAGPAGRPGPVGQLSVLGSTMGTVDGRQRLPMGPRQLLPVHRRGRGSRGLLRCAFSRSSKSLHEWPLAQEVTSDTLCSASPAGRPLAVIPAQRGSLVVTGDTWPGHSIFHFTELCSQRAASVGVLAHSAGRRSCPPAPSAGR